MRNEMTIQEWLDWQESPAGRDPQRNDPEARLSKATARVIMSALFYIDFARRKGYYVHDMFDEYEVERARSIMLKIIDSQTEEKL